MKPEIYLDMDGVCVDFMGATIAAHGLDSEEMLQKWRDQHPGSLYPEALFGMSAESFFTHSALGEDRFWRDLEPYPWFEDMFESLSAIGHVVFLTAPTAQPGCVAGKHQWLNNMFGNDFSDFIFTRHKDRLAHDNAILIDDLPRNIEVFRARTGHGVLFPQTWNEHLHIEDASGFVVDSIKKIAEV
jgi:5'(3')-deoxyribonucleotidase